MGKPCIKSFLKLAVKLYEPKQKDIQNKHSEKQKSMLIETQASWYTYMWLHLFLLLNMVSVNAQV